jgi:hypothetical protein
MGASVTFYLLPALRLLLAHIAMQSVVRDRIPAARRLHPGVHNVGIALLRASLYCLALWNWSDLWIPIAAIAVSVAFEFRRVQPPTRPHVLVRRLGLHTLALAFIWALSTRPPISSIGQLLEVVWATPAYWIIALGYVLVVWPIGYVTGVFTAPWRGAIEGKSPQGLQNAGLWIGRLERVLIVTAILANQFALIGFLVAAKSVLRFADIQNNKNRQEAEYVLVGTLFSFTAAIGIGLLMKLLLANAAATP